MRKTRGRCRSSFFCREAKRPLSDRKVGPTKHPGTSMMETIVGLIDLPATRSTLKKQRSAHSREFFSGDQWKESICCFNTVKQHILSLTVKKTWLAPSRRRWQWP
ncbi:hypothetical protein [Aneurinibacillus terranovensis]|uniref:hypothetical protein n=1 Tax=Aneurinibacillus terranovensis TaxID=278991 RepID=UPI0012DF441B|nr:hypothetical protein [Aneurinibacillus terranovensis]